MSDFLETERLIKSVKKNRKGIGACHRVCICGNTFPHFDDGTNTWDLCLPCKRAGRTYNVAIGMI